MIQMRRFVRSSGASAAVVVVTGGPFRMSARARCATRRSTCGGRSRNRGRGRGSTSPSPAVRKAITTICTAARARGSSAPTPSRSATRRVIASSRSRPMPMKRASRRGSRSMAATRWACSAAPSPAERTCSRARARRSSTTADQPRPPRSWNRRSKSSSASGLVEADHGVVLRREVVEEGAARHVRLGAGLLDREAGESALRGEAPADPGEARGRGLAAALSKTNGCTFHSRVHCCTIRQIVQETSSSIDAVGCGPLAAR